MILELKEVVEMPCRYISSLKIFEHLLPNDAGSGYAPE